MQTIAFRLIKGIMLIPADGGAVAAAVNAGFSGSAAAAGRIIECPNLTAVSGRIPVEKRIIRTNLPHNAGNVRQTRKTVFSPDFRRQWKLFCLQGLRHFGRFSAVHFDQIQH